MDRMPLNRTSMMGMMGNPMSSMFGSSGGSSQPFSLIGNMDLNNVGMGSSSSMGMGSSQGMMSSLPSGLMGMGMSGMSVMEQMAKEAEMRRIMESDIEVDRRGGRQDYGNRREMDMYDDRMSPRNRSSGLLPAPEIPPLLSDMGQRRDMRGNRGRDLDRGRMDQRDHRDRRSEAQRREEWRRNDPRYSSSQSRSNRGEGRRDSRDSRGRSDSNKGTGTGERSGSSTSRKRHTEDGTNKDGAKVVKKDEGNAPSESKAEAAGDGDKAEKETKPAEDKDANYCLTCDVTFEGTFMEHRNGPEHKGKVNHDSKNFCRTCDVNFDGQFINHRLSIRHKELMDVFLAKGCELCKIGSFTHYMKWKDHMMTMNHKRLEKRALAAQRISEIEEKMDTIEASEAGSGSGEEDAASEKDGFKQPKSPGMKDTGGEVDRPSSEVAIGQEFVVQVTGYFCKLCHKFYTNETAAKVTHCQTQSHYVKLQKYISSKLKPAPAATAKPATKSPAPAAKSSTQGAAKSSAPAKKPNKRMQKEVTKSDAANGVKETEAKKSDEKKEEETEVTKASTAEVKPEAEVKHEAEDKNETEDKKEAEVEGGKTEDVQSPEDAVTADNNRSSEEAEAGANDEEAEDEEAMETTVAKDTSGPIDDNDDEAEVPEEDGDEAEADDVSAAASKKSTKKRQVSKRGRKVKK